MKFGLEIRGRHKAGEDMRQRHADDLALARRAGELGFDSVGKASHYSSPPYQMAQQIPFLAQVAVVAHNRIHEVDRQMVVYRRELDRCDIPSPKELPVTREMFVASSRAEAIRLAGPYSQEKYRAYNAWGQDKELPGGDAFDVAFEQLMEDRFLLGTAAEVTEQLARLCRRTGCNYIIVYTHLPGMPNSMALEQMGILANEVFPALQQAA